MTGLPDGLRPGGRFASWSPTSVPAYVVCDVDGTLVGPTAEASAEVVAAVARAQDGGLRVGFATGRMRGAVGPLWEQLRAQGPHLLHNGAEVRADGRTVASWTLTAAQVDDLLAIAHSRDDAYVEVYTEDAFHASSHDERARPHWELLGARPASVLHSAAELDGQPVLKATFAVFDPATVPDIVDEVRALGLAAGPAGSPRTPGIVYCNATHPDADKGAALRRACQHLGIAPAATVAVGDADNDHPMLAVAGTAIAMGQASPTVVEAAHLVVPDVDSHGVAVALDWALAAREGAGGRAGMTDLPPDRRRPHPDRLSDAHPAYERIVAAHEAALRAGQDGYLDPDTGLFVLSAGYLWARGRCCGSGCRHCPWVERDAPA